MVQDSLSIHPRKADKFEDLEQLLRRGKAKLSGAQGEHLSIPAPLYSLLKSAIRNLSQGRSLLLIPEERQLTTQQAADLLRVSRPFLIRLLDAGEIPFHLVGKHRRIQVSDLVAYSRRKSSRKAALDKLGRDARAAGLYDKHIGIPVDGSDE